MTNLFPRSWAASRPISASAMPARRPISTSRRSAATEVLRMPPDEKGRYMHIHLLVNGGSLMLADAFPDHGHPLETQGGYTLHLQVDDADAWWKRAVEAGAEPLMPVTDMFWGDRYGQFRDPFGVRWSVGTTIKKS